MTMQIIFYTPDSEPDTWRSALGRAFARVLPDAAIRAWQPGDDSPADYAIVWRPPVDMLRGRSDLKAIFVLGAGVDAMLKLGATLPADVPLVRLEDGGMAAQMAQYVSHAVLRYFRQLDHYALQAQQRVWQQHVPRAAADFSVGIMGLGVLGSYIALAVQQLGFPVLGWSHTQKNLPDVTCYAGDAGLTPFLQSTRVLVCALPLTQATTDILNYATLRQLPRGAYLINVARGMHLVEEDLLTLISEQRIAAATLDVFRTEPLPLEHPFWQEPRIAITPHISALTLHDESAVQIAAKIVALENGQVISGIVDLALAY